MPSVGLLYHFFGSKEGIAAAVYLDALRDYQREFVAALERSRDPGGGVRGAVRAHIRWVLGNPDSAQFLFAVAGADVSRAARAELRVLNDDFFVSRRSLAERARLIRCASLGVH